MGTLGSGPGSNFCLNNSQGTRITVIRHRMRCGVVSSARILCSVRSKEVEITLKERMEDGVSSKPLKEVERLDQRFNIKNEGPGLMPLVDVQVLLPHVNDSFGLVASQTVTVSNSASGYKRVK